MSALAQSGATSASARPAARCLQNLQASLARKIGAIPAATCREQLTGLKMGGNPSVCSFARFLQEPAVPQLLDHQLCWPSRPADEHHVMLPHSIAAYCQPTFCPHGSCRGPLHSLGSERFAHSFDQLANLQARSSVAHLLPMVHNCEPQKVCQAVIWVRDACQCLRRRSWGETPHGSTTQQPRITLEG